MLRFIAAVALLAGLRASAAPLSFELTDAGVLKVSDGQPLARAIVNMHAVGWAGANNETQAEGTSREGDTVRGAVRLPAQLAGKLGYSVTATKEDYALKAHYSLRFTEATEIQGAYISFMLPAARLQGRQATLWRTGQSRPLPAQGESANLSGPACAFSVEIGEGKSFVIASAATAAVMVQDNRVYGASDYEVRFSVFGNAKVGPALVADRSFHILIANTAEVAALVDGILVVNNLRDIANDRAKGKRTLATVIGAAATRMHYALLLVFAYGSVAAGAAIGALPAPALLMMLSLPAAWAAWRVVRTESAPLPLTLGGIRATAQLHMRNGLLLSAGLVAAAGLLR